ncbi:hypothetical protein CsSME_00043414 [Camellia sinensis var. sinensis]
MPCVDDVYSPPFLIVKRGTTTIRIPQINHNDSSPPLSSSSPSSSLIIVIIIIASSVIITASLYLLLRFITRHYNKRSSAAVDGVVSSRTTNTIQIVIVVTALCVYRSLRGTISYGYFLYVVMLSILIALMRGFRPIKRVCCAGPLCIQLRKLH